MSKRTWMILLDIVLFLSMVALIAPVTTGIPLHEWLGIFLFLLVIPHLLSSWPWIRRNTVDSFRNKNWRQRFIYLINAVFFIFLVLSIFTGLMISAVCFPAWGKHPVTGGNWHGLHEFFSNSLIALIILHLALNWNIIISYFRKTGAGSSSMNAGNMQAFLKIAGRILLIVFTAVVFCTLIYFLIERTHLLQIDEETESHIYPARWNPGLFQFIGGIILIPFFAYVCWRWLKIRL
jgi:Domain of unknown function (DUF4405)